MSALVSVAARTIPALVLGVVAAACNPPAARPENLVPAVAGRNEAVSLEITGFQVAARLGDRAAPPHRAWLVLETRWRNLMQPVQVAKEQPSDAATVGALGSGPRRPAGATETRNVAYVVPRIADHLFVLVDGADVGRIGEATEAAPHPLNTDTLAVADPARPVAGDYVFEIPDRAAASLEVLFLDNNFGNIGLAVKGTPPPPSKPLAGPVANEVLAVAVERVRETDAIDAAPAPQGRRFAVVDLRLRPLQGEALFHFEPLKAAALLDAAGFFYRATDAVHPDGGLDDPSQLLPGIAQHAALAFVVPPDHGPLTFVLDLPGVAALEIALPDTGPPASAIPAPLLALDDGDTLSVAVVGIRRGTAIGTLRAKAGEAFLVLDLVVADNTADGIEFQTAEQLLLAGGDAEFSIDEDALGFLAHPLVENTVLPPHRRTRFEVAYRIPANLAALALHYRGFEAELTKPLPPAR